MSSYTNSNDNANTRGGVHTVDPDATADSTVGWRPLAMWLNTTTMVLWVCVSANPGAAQWVPLSAQSQPGYASGDTINPEGLVGTSTSALNTAARTVAFPIIVPHKLSISAIGLNVTANSTGAQTARFGIYANTLQRPGALILDAGTIDLSSGALTTRSVSLGTPLSLLPGSYWVAVAFSTNAAPASVTCASSSVRNFPGSVLAAYSYVSTTDYSAALPAAIAGLVGSSSIPNTPMPILTVA